MTCQKYEPAKWPHGTRSCVRCGRLPKHHQRQEHPAAEYASENRGQPRNKHREQMLVEVAARATGLASDGGLWQFADARAWPGPVRTGLNATQEIGEELADGCNYACWGIEQVYDRMLEGDSEATAQYEKLMRCLSHVVAAWDALVRG